MEAGSNAERKKYDQTRGKLKDKESGDTDIHRQNNNHLYEWTKKQLSMQSHKQYYWELKIFLKKHVCSRGRCMVKM